MIERLRHTVRKLSGWQGYDISELVKDGLIEEGDMG